MKGLGGVTGDDAMNSRCPWKMKPRQVIDLHADLHKMLTHMDAEMRAGFEAYGIQDVMANPHWGPSHLHPAKKWNDLSPWLDSLGRDLFGAATYQVTEEMIDLAEVMLETTPAFEDIREEELPAPWGFMWLDRPIPRPSFEDKPGQDPLLMHAISWAIIPQIEVNVRIMDRKEDEPVHIAGEPGEYSDRELGEIVHTVYCPAVRVREWGWNDSANITPRPLHLMGQSVVILTERVHTPLKELHLVHMIWLLMQMEIVCHTRVPADRHGVRRSQLRHNDVDVVTLRRPTKRPDTDNVEHRHVDWSCTWLVRGHGRHLEHYEGPHHRAVYKEGRCKACGKKSTYIRPYIKGPEGLPLKASDVLYKLSR